LSHPGWTKKRPLGSYFAFSALKTKKPSLTLHLGRNLKVGSFRLKEPSSERLDS
jgi:hypothetical protein